MIAREEEKWELSLRVKGMTMTWAAQNITGC
jgi:hypothetical protein